MAHVTKGTCKVSTQACVYMLINPIRCEPFYVGIGKVSRPLLHFKHENGNRFRWNVINKLRREGIDDSKMLVYLARDLPADVARITEEWLVASWGRRSQKKGPLTNLSPGGEKNVMEDPRTRAKWEIAMRDPEYIEKRTAALRKAHNDPNVKAKASARMHAYYADPNFRAKQKEGAKLAAKRPEVRDRLIKHVHIVGFQKGKNVGDSNPAKRDDVRKKISEFATVYSAKPEVKKRRAEFMTARNADPLFKEKLRAISQTPEWQVQHANALKRLNSDPEIARKRTEGVRISNAKPEVRKKISDARSTPEAIAKQAARMNAQWADPEFRARMSAVRKEYHAKRRAEKETANASTQNA